MVHLLRKFGELIDTLEYGPRMFFLNPARNLLHAWFPNSIKPVCRDSDIFCANSNGLIKLEDVVPGCVMDGLDWAVDHPYRVFGLVATGACLFTAFHLYRNRAKQQHPERLQELPVRVEHEHRQLRTAFARSPSKIKQN